ncbi:hypothetical protein J7T55_008787 [Diaporthe amygdali]|uniref:uncharacterized protein n=1 Tax=Phomopsis amygdali TaxID=1214568 RepID=UPI0022FDF394|nr:uncharacterized protein J7T55_008787 [Diaporthe amygdali]KAJ0121621.1 hypothetical protein J7T55_008787 [Diaporthe amygdali]
MSPTKDKDAKSNYEPPNEKSCDFEGNATPASQHSPSSDEDTNYATGLKLFFITLALCLAVFLMALDQSIIATAIPKITNDFNSLDDVGWYGSAYLLTTASLQLLFGKFYTFLNIKWVFLTAIGIFELGSLICGVAQNSITFIIGRAIAGVGSAGMFSGGLLIIVKSLPLVKRPLYTGIISSMYGIASVAGPLLGGVFADKATWRWCFFINLPIGAVAVITILLVFHPPKTTLHKTESLAARINHFDPIGTIIFIPAIVCLLLALQWGGTTYPWSSGRIVALFVLAGVLLIIFLGVQMWKQEDATVPPHIVKKRSVWSSAVFSFCLGASQFIMIYYVPIWFQAVQGVSAVESGLRVLPMLISSVVLALLSGVAVTLIGYYTPFMILTTILMSIGSGLSSTWQPDTGSPVWIGYQILFGAGFGMGLQQPMLAVQTVLDPVDISTGCALMTFLQSLGGALFVSVGNTVFSNQLLTALTKYAPGVNPLAVLSAGATNFRDVLPMELLPGVILGYNNALTRTFLVSAGMAAATIFGSAIVEWKNVKGKPTKMVLG